MWSHRSLAVSPGSFLYTPSRYFAYFLYLFPLRALKRHKFCGTILMRDSAPSRSILVTGGSVQVYRNIEAQATSICSVIDFKLSSKFETLLTTEFALRDTWKIYAISGNTDDVFVIDPLNAFNPRGRPSTTTLQNWRCRFDGSFGDVTGDKVSETFGRIRLWRWPHWAAKHHDFVSVRVRNFINITVNILSSFSWSIFEMNWGKENWVKEDGVSWSSVVFAVTWNNFTNSIVLY